MRVVVTVWPGVRDQLYRLHRSRSATWAEALRNTGRSLEQLEQVLTECGGVPPDARLWAGGSVGVWWVSAGGVWFALTRGVRYEGPEPTGEWVTEFTVVQAVSPGAGTPQ